MSDRTPILQALHNGRTELGLDPDPRIAHELQSRPWLRLLLPSGAWVNSCLARIPTGVEIRALATPAPPTDGPVSTRAAVGCADGTIRIVDSRSLREVHNDQEEVLRWPAHCRYLTEPDENEDFVDEPDPSGGRGVECLAWHGELLASGGRDGTAAVWDLSRSPNEPLWRSFEGTPVLSVAWHSDGWLALGDMAGNLEVWDPSHGMQLWQARLKGPIHSVGWHRDGRLASGSADGTLDVWDPHAGPHPIWSVGCGRGITTVSWNLDGRLATGTTDGWIKVWWPGWTPQPEWQARAHPTSVTCLAWNEQRWLASGGDDQVGVWDPGSAADVLWRQVTDKAVYAVAWSADGALLSGGADCSLAAWLPSPSSRASGEALSSLRKARAENENHPVWAAAWSSEGRLATAAWSGTLAVWEGDQSAPTWWVNCSRRVECLAWRPNGYLAAGTSGLGVSVWRPETDSERPIWEVGADGHPVWRRVTAVDWHPKDWLLVGTEAGRLAAWDVERGTEPIWHARGHRRGIASLICRADGQIATAEVGGRIAVWCPGTKQREPFWTAPSHPLRVSLAWHPSGLLASGGGDGLVVLWSPDGERSEVWRTQVGGCVEVLAWGESGRNLVAGLSDGRIIVLDAIRGAVEARYCAPGGVLAVWCSPDGAEIRAIDGTMQASYLRVYRLALAGRW